MAGENLTYIYGAWLDWSRKHSDHYMAVSEVFDEQIIIQDSVYPFAYYLIPYVGSSGSGRAVFGKPKEINLEYCYYTNESIWDRVANGLVEISRPASGRACLLSKKSGETICIVAEGYLEDANFSSDIVQYTVEEG